MPTSFRSRSSKTLSRVPAPTQSPSQAQLRAFKRRTTAFTPTQTQASAVPFEARAIGQVTFAESTSSSRGGLAGV